MDRVANGILRLGLVFAAVLLVSCSQRARANDAEPPKARGTVKVERIDERHLAFELEVRNLLAPQKLAQEATTYVVWVRALDAHWSALNNVGTLQVDHDMVGRLQGLTALRHFQILVTPEPSQAAAAPTGTPVMSTEIRK